MNKEFIIIPWAKWHMANFDMPMWCQFGWHMSSSNLINLMTLIWNLSLNFDVAFCNWLDKFLPPTEAFFFMFRYRVVYNSFPYLYNQSIFFFMFGKWVNTPNLLLSQWNPMEPFEEIISRTWYSRRKRKKKLRIVLLFS